jgi:hypothetical protein
MISELVLLGKTKNGLMISPPSGGLAVVDDEPVFGFGKIIIIETIKIPRCELVTKRTTRISFLGR